MTTPNATPRPGTTLQQYIDLELSKLREERDQLKAERDVLTERCADLNRILEALNRGLDSYKAENAKLREALGRLLDQTAGPGSLSYDQAKKQARAALAQRKGE